MHFRVINYDKISIDDYRAAEYFPSKDIGKVLMEQFYLLEIFLKVVAERKQLMGHKLSAKNYTLVCLLKNTPGSSGKKAICSGF